MLYGDQVVSSLTKQDARMKAGNIPLSPRSRSVKNVAGTKLENTSLSADVFQRALQGYDPLSSGLAVVKVNEME